MKPKQIFIFVILIIVAILLAPFGYALVQGLLIEPLAYLWYLIKMFVGALSQQVLWLLVLSILALAVFVSLLRNIRPRQSDEPATLPRKGPVETLAWEIERTQRGNYFKWLLANRLSLLANRILGNHEGAHTIAPRSSYGRNGNAPAAIQNYLEAGIKHSFMEYRQKKFFSRQPSTPFNIEIDTVIEYLESLME